MLLKNVTETKQKGYLESYETDQELLKREGISFNQKNCIMFRMGEKRVLRFFVTLAEEGLKVIQGKVEIILFVRCHQKKTIEAG